MSDTNDATGTASSDADTDEGRRSAGTGGSLPSRVALYYRQVVGELGKVVWPGRRQLLTYTVVVIVFVVVVMAYITGVDAGFGLLIDQVFGR